MSYRVLLVDDDRMPTNYYSYALKEKGFEVIHCEDADLAQHVWRSVILDLVILDLMMPPGERVRPEETKEGLHTGLVLYRQLYQDLPEVPVIVLTNLRSAGELIGSDPRVKVLYKTQVPPLDLATIAEQTVKMYTGLLHGSTQNSY